MDETPHWYTETQANARTKLFRLSNRYRCRRCNAEIREERRIDPLLGRPGETRYIECYCRVQARIEEARAKADAAKLKDSLPDRVASVETGIRALGLMLNNHILGDDS